MIAADLTIGHRVIVPNGSGRGTVTREVIGKRDARDEIMLTFVRINRDGGRDGAPFTVRVAPNRDFELAPR